MYQVLRKSWDKNKYLILSGFIIAFLFLLTVVYKSDERIIKKSESIQNLLESPDLETFKKWIGNGKLKNSKSGLNIQIYTVCL